MMSWNNTSEGLSNISKIIKLVGILSKIAGIITIFGYISGFIIINSYLSKYGLNPEEIFGAKYLSAGLLFLIIAGILTINWWFLRVSQKIKEEYKDSKEKIKSKLYPLMFFVVTLWPSLINIFLSKSCDPV